MYPCAVSLKLGMHANFLKLGVSLIQNKSLGLPNGSTSLSNKSSEPAFKGFAPLKANLASQDLIKSKQIWFYKLVSPFLKAVFMQPYLDRNYTKAFFIFWDGRLIRSGEASIF